MNSWHSCLTPAPVCNCTFSRDGAECRAIFAGCEAAAVPGHLMRVQETPCSGSTASLPVLLFQLTLPWCCATCYKPVLWRHCQVFHSSDTSKGCWKQAQGGNVSPCPWCLCSDSGWEHGEQALNVSTLFLVRFVSCRISSGRQLPVGKYFWEFLEVPPPPTGKDLCPAAELCPATLGEQGDHLVPQCVESHPSVVSQGKLPVLEHSHGECLAVQKTKLSFISW